MRPRTTWLDRRRHCYELSERINSLTFIASCCTKVSGLEILTTSSRFKQPKLIANPSAKSCIVMASLKVCREVGAVTICVCGNAVGLRSRQHRLKSTREDPGSFSSGPCAYERPIDE